MSSESLHFLLMHVNGEMDQLRGMSPVATPRNYHE